MWDIKLKLTDTDKQQHSDYLREGGGWKRVKGAKYMVMGDLALGGGHTVQCTHHVSEKCAPETYIMLTQYHPNVKLPPPQQPFMHRTFYSFSPSLSLSLSVYVYGCIYTCNSYIIYIKPISGYVY